MGLGLDGGLTTDSSDPLGMDPWSTNVPTNLLLDPYSRGDGLGGMGGSALGNLTSPEPIPGEPSMPYHCKSKFLVT